jgi:hypothetical protein
MVGQHGQIKNFSLHSFEEKQRIEETQQTQQTQKN